MPKESRATGSVWIYAPSTGSRGWLATKIDGDCRGESKGRCEGIGIIREIHNESSPTIIEWSSRDRHITRILRGTSNSHTLVIHGS